MPYYNYSRQLLDGYFGVKITENQAFHNCCNKHAKNHKLQENLVSHADRDWCKILDFCRNLLQDVGGLKGKAKVGRAEI